MNIESCTNMCCLTNYRMHYNVMLMGMDVDGASLDLPPSIIRNGGTIVDSGTTLAYFPKVLYDSLIETVTYSAHISSV